jgi:hypothetical protein
MPESLFPASLTVCNLLNLLGKFTGSIALSIDLGFLCQRAAAEITNSLFSAQKCIAPYVSDCTYLVIAPVGVATKVKDPVLNSLMHDF